MAGPTFTPISPTLADSHSAGILPPPDIPVEPLFFGPAEGFLGAGAPAGPTALAPNGAGVIPGGAAFSGGGGAVGGGAGGLTGGGLGILNISGLIPSGGLIPKGTFDGIFDGVVDGVTENVINPIKEFFSPTPSNLTVARDLAKELGNPNILSGAANLQGLTSTADMGGPLLGDPGTNGLEIFGPDYGKLLQDRLQPLSNLEYADRVNFAKLAAKDTLPQNAHGYISQGDGITSVYQNNMNAASKMGRIEGFNGIDNPYYRASDLGSNNVTGVASDFADTTFGRGFNPIMNANSATLATVPSPATGGSGIPFGGLTGSEAQGVINSTVSPTPSPFGNLTGGIESALSSVGGLSAVAPFAIGALGLGIGMHRMSQDNTTYPAISTGFTGKDGKIAVSGHQSSHITGPGADIAQDYFSDVLQQATQGRNVSSDLRGGIHVLSGRRGTESGTGEGSYMVSVNGQQDKFYKTAPEAIEAYLKGAHKAGMISGDLDSLLNKGNAYMDQKGQLYDYARPRYDAFAAAQELRSRNSGAPGLNPYNQINAEMLDSIAAGDLAPDQFQSFGGIFDFDQFRKSADAKQGAGFNFMNLLFNQDGYANPDDRSVFDTAMAANRFDPGI